MANLTWRDVQTPDFRTSLEGIRAFTDQLGAGFSGLERGLNTYDASISDRVNRDFAIRVAQLQDADAASKALADGTVFGSPTDRNRLSSAAIAAASLRPTELYKQDASRIGVDVSKLALDDARYSSTRIRDTNSRTDAARPDVNAFLAAALSGKTGAVTEAMRNIDSSAFADIAKGGSGLLTDDLNRDGKRQDMSQSATNFSNAQTDRMEGRAAQALALQVMELSGGTADGARLTLADPRFANVPATVKAAALGMINSGLSGGIYAGGGDAGISIPGSDAKAFNTTVGGGTANITGMTIGQAIDYGKNVLIPQTMGDARLGLKPGQGSSAMGAFQITQGTMKEFGPKVFGSNWASTPLTPENQDKLGEAIFNSAKGSASALAGRWASLTPAEAEQVRKMPWSQARQVIARGEVGSGLGNIATNNIAQSSLGVARMQNDPTGITAGMTAALDDKTPIGQVADNLLKGSFKGTNRTLILNQLNRIMRDSKVDGQGGMSAAAAAQILERNITGEDMGIMRKINPRSVWEQVFGDRVTPNLPGGQRINDDGVDAEVARFRRGDTIRDIATQANNVSKSAQLPQLQAAALNAAGAYASIAARAQTSRVNPAVIATARARAEAAQAAYDQAVRQSNSPQNGGAPVVTRPNSEGGNFWLNLARRGAPGKTIFD